MSPGRSHILSKRCLFSSVYLLGFLLTNSQHILLQSSHSDFTQEKQERKMWSLFTQYNVHQKAFKNR